MARTVRRWTAAEDEQLRRLNKDGLSLYKTSETMGWSLSTVSRKARSLGLVWTGRVPGEFVAARREALEQTRADVLAAMWEQAQGMLARMAAPEFTDLVRGEYGVEHMVKLSAPPTRSLRDLSAAAVNLAKTAAAIEANARANQDSSDLRAFLLHMAGATVTQDSTTSDISGGDDAPGSTGGVPPQPGTGPPDPAE